MVYKAALLGCGTIGGLGETDLLINGIYTHAAAYTACPDIELVAVCDIDKTKAFSCAKKWGVSQVYSSFNHLLNEERPEIVSIATPDETHGELLNCVLQAPHTRAILVEKPLATNTLEALHLIKKAKEKNIVVAVNYSRRYSTQHHQVKEFIDSGKLGSIQKVSGFYTKGIMHNGTHWIDLARWLCGEIISVQGFDASQQNVSDPTIDALFNFQNGARGFLHNLDANAFSLFEMDIIGTRGRIHLTSSGHVIDYFSVKDSPYYSGYLTLQKTHTHDGGLTNTMLNAVCDLIVCLKTGATPQSSAHDGLIALQIASALIHSSQHNSKLIPIAGATLCTVL